MTLIVFLLPTSPLEDAFPVILCAVESEWWTFSFFLLHEIILPKIKDIEISILPRKLFVHLFVKILRSMRQRRDLFGLLVKLSPVTTCLYLTTQT